MPEYFIWQASEILKCSYVTLAYHEDRDELIRTAYTMRDAREGIQEVLKADAESKAKLAKPDA